MSIQYNHIKPYDQSLAQQTKQTQLFAIIPTILFCLIALVFTVNVAKATGEMKGHQHDLVAIPAKAKQPQLSVKLYPDPLSGYNLHLELVNYRIEPPEKEAAQNQETTDSIENLIIGGHAHLFVNGKKIRRLYSRYTHVPGSLLNEGINNITVTLNSHQHNSWTLDGRPLTSSVTIDTNKSKAVIHEFSSSPITEATKN